MEWFLGLRPIRLFSFYLALIVVLATLRRLEQYRTVLSLLVRMKSRWPRLTDLVLAHRGIFLTWGTIRPLVIVLALLLINLLASQLVWPQAGHFHIRDLVPIWPTIPVIVLTALVMVGFDVYGLLRVHPIDQTALEAHFDTAESWLAGWKAPVVRVLSLGFVNPRKIVAKEVAGSLENVSGMINRSLWWVTLTTTLRILCGLALWGSYAMQRWVEALLNV